MHFGGRDRISVREVLSREHGRQPDGGTLSEHVNIK